MLPQGDEDRARFRVIRDGEIHILGHIMVSGVRYSHAIVIEAAMYLYRQLTRNESISTPEDAGEILQISLAPEDVFAARQSWLCFEWRTRNGLRGWGAIHFTHGKGSEVKAPPDARPLMGLPPVKATARHYPPPLPCGTSSQRPSRISKMVLSTVTIDPPKFAIHSYKGRFPSGAGPA